MFYPLPKLNTTLTLQHIWSLILHVVKFSPEFSSLELNPNYEIIFIFQPSNIPLSRDGYWLNIQLCVLLRNLLPSIPYKRTDKSLFWQLLYPIQPRAVASNLVARRYVPISRLIIVTTRTVNIICIWAHLAEKKINISASLATTHHHHHQNLFATFSSP